MDLTESFRQVVPGALSDRYEFRETRNASAILAATNPEEFADVLTVLGDFSLSTDDLVVAGGNESKIAARLNHAFRQRGWREGRVDTSIKISLRVMPFKEAGETSPRVADSEVFSEGYLVDNTKGRIALDVEWNAKDGNLDRDVGAYRALYDAGLIDAAVLITRTHDDLRALAYELSLREGLGEAHARSRLSTTTTTNLTKLIPRMTRGDTGGCPFLAAAICARTWSDAAAEPLRAGEPDLFSAS